MKFKLNKHGIKAYTELLKKRILYAEKKSMEFLWNELYNKTPIRTGAARSSWNISVNHPNYAFDKNKHSAEFIMPNLKVNDTLIISSGCPYIKILNNGSSSQAPKNFIQISIVNAKKYFNKLKIKDIDHVL